MARMHGGRRPNEKAKDFKGTMKKLIRYMAIYKVQVFFVAEQYSILSDRRF